MELEFLSISSSLGASLRIRISIWGSYCWFENFYLYNEVVNMTFKILVKPGRKKDNLQNAIFVS